MGATDGMGTRIVRPVDQKDFDDLKQLVEYMDQRLIELEREMLALTTPAAAPST